MLIWVTALHCEAKPLIDFYRLKKSSQKNDFDIYQNQQIFCVVSGIGANKMSRAITWVNKLFNAQKDCRWINLGIAGHKNLPIGTTVLINQATQAGSNKSISSITEISHEFETRPVISQIAENTDYDEISVFDMEAFSFFLTAQALSAINLCQSIKIISDNRVSPPTRDKAFISQLIAKNMREIALFAGQLKHEACSKTP